MKVTNLHLLPDGGLRLKQAIKKEENALKDTTTQLNNVLEKLHKFRGKYFIIFFSLIKLYINEIKKPNMYKMLTFIVFGNNMYL